MIDDFGQFKCQKFQRRPPEDIQRMKEAFLAEIQAEKPQKREEPSPGELSQAAGNILTKAGLESGTFLMAIYDDLGLHHSEGRSAVEELLARGLIRIHRLPRIGRGGQPETLEVTDRGYEELEKRGIKRPGSVLKGGFLHDLYGRKVRQYLKQQGCRCWFEKKLGRKAFDLLFQREDGSLGAVEICRSGAASYNARQALKGLENEGITELILVCETKALSEAIKKQLKKMDQLGFYKDKVRTRLVAEFL